MTLAVQFAAGHVAVAIDGELRACREPERPTSVVDALGGIDASGHALVLVVPEAAARGDLGRMLAEARAAELRPAAFVGAAALDAAQAVTAFGGEWSAAPALIHLDVGASDSRASLVLAAADGWRCRRSMRVAVGMADLDRAALQLAARVIVAGTRYDPLHRAEDEAALRATLAGLWPGMRAAGAARGVVRAGEDEITFALTRDQVREALAPPLQVLLSALVALQVPARFVLLAPQRLLDLPGVTGLLAAAGATAQAALVPGGTAAAASLLSVAAPTGEAVPLMLRAAAPSAALSTAPRAVDVPDAPPYAAPTHLVVEGRARRIDAAGLVLGRAPPGTGARDLVLPAGLAGVSRRHCTLRTEGVDVVLIDHSRHGCFLDGRRVQGCARLRAGDRLRLGTPGIELQLVAIA
jgi:hypothetical protein